MDIFLDTYNPWRLNQKDVNNLSKYIWSKRIETAKINLPTTAKIPGPDGFTAEFYQTFREKLITMLQKLLYKTKRGDNAIKSFYEVTIAVTKMR